MSTVIHYFDGWGRAERIRWLLWINNHPFTDQVYEWEEWLGIRDKTEFGQLPLVEMDGHKLVQSLSIERYIARKFGIVPQDSYHEYLVDSVLGVFDDFFRHFAEFLIYNSDLEGYVNYYNNELKKNLSFIEQRIEENGGNGFVVGNSITLADFAVAEFVQDVFLSGPRKGTLAPVITNGNPKLVEFTQNFIKKFEVLVQRVATRSDKDY